MKDTAFDPIPLFMPRSSASTAVNKTGSWRFFHPRYEEKTAPCSAACPLGQDIARIEMLASRGMFKAAWQKILMENPFPAVCGRVCFHTCETTCNRQNLDEAVGVHNLERFLGDFAIARKLQPEINAQPRNGKKVAIAGAGPAGLAAAYFLTQLGYDCDIFEARDAPGGLLRWGIPAYRLPRKVLTREIKRIENAGVTIHLHHPVTSGRLKMINRRFDALIVACGYPRPISLNIEGGELVRDGLDFLSRISLEKKIFFQGTAAVIGGGNTAVDVARCLVRLGASPLIVYRRRIKDMPAFAPEVKMARDEGVKIMPLYAPIGIRQRKHGTGDPPEYTLILQKMKISQKPIDGRARIVPDGDKTRQIRVQHIFAAVGAEPERLWQIPDDNRQAHMQLGHCKLAVDDLPQIFVGDLTTPVKSVSDAIASGKQAAMALDIYFSRGPTAVVEELGACRVGPGPALSMARYRDRDRTRRSPHIVAYDEIVADYFDPAARRHPPSVDAARRIGSFGETESSLTARTAKQEAARCFNCGTCNDCDNCRLFCPEMAVIVEKNRRWINMDYCKGCGVCTVECPRNAMALEEEAK